MLINIFDQAWKDHLYAMDVLKGGIGMQAFAERDPRIAYKREGYRYFRQMMEEVRDRVTDLIFRVQVQGQRAPEPKDAYGEGQAVHAEVDDNAAAFGEGEPVAATPAPPRPRRRRPSRRPQAAAEEGPQQEGQAEVAQADLGRMLCQCVERLSEPSGGRRLGEPLHALSSCFGFRWVHAGSAGG